MDILSRIPILCIGITALVIIIITLPSSMSHRSPIRISLALGTIMILYNLLNLFLEILIKLIILSLSLSMSIRLCLNIVWLIPLGCFSN